MTHGGLAVSDNHHHLSNRLLLHTWADGMDIPEVVTEVVNVLVVKHKYLFDGAGASADYIRQTMRDCGVGHDWVQQASAVAALIIAARPCFLRPVTPSEMRRWTGWLAKDIPFRLHVGVHGWVLFEGSKTLLRFDPLQKLTEAMVTAYASEISNITAVPR